MVESPCGLRSITWHQIPLVIVLSFIQYFLLAYIFLSPVTLLDPRFFVYKGPQLTYQAETQGGYLYPPSNPLYHSFQTSPYSHCNPPVELFFAGNQHRIKTQPFIEEKVCIQFSPDAPFSLVSGDCPFISQLPSHE